jgi:hypothetical protein
MSRVIDETVPLSDADREFLNNNGQENRVRRLDEVHGVEPSLPPYMTGNEPSLQSGVPAGVLDAPGLSPAGLAANVGAPSMAAAVAMASDEALEAELERRRNAAQATSGEDDYATSDVVESDDYPYEDWSSAQLKAQLGHRELSKAGTKAEMAQRLRDNDAS